MARRPRPFEGRASDQFRHPGGSGRMLSGGRLAAGLVVVHARVVVLAVRDFDLDVPGLWKPRIAKPSNNTWTGMISSVTRPRMPSSSAGELKPALSRSNHCGPAIAAKIARMMASAATSGRTPRFQRAA